MELIFKRTCYACPEQYDVTFENGRQIAYIRLRFGQFRVDYPDVGGEIIFQYYFDDDMKGTFKDDEERMKFLGYARDAIEKKLMMRDKPIIVVDYREGW